MIKKLIIILVFLEVYFFAGAQTKDTQLWTGPIIKYNITKKFRIEFEQQFRFNENISNYDYTFSELGIRYKVFKYLNIKALYRYTFVPDNHSNDVFADSDKSRLSFDAATGIDVFNTGLRVGYRFRYMNSRDNKTTASSNYLRNRFDLEYNLSKLVDPYAAYESAYRLDDKNEFRYNRYTLGLNWKVSKKLDIDSYFHYQNEINVKHPETNYILGLAVVYTIN
jgi:hypothetical protein